MNVPGKMFEKALHGFAFGLGMGMSVAVLPVPRPRRNMEPSDWPDSARADAWGTRRSPVAILESMRGIEEIEVRGDDVLCGQAATR